MKYNDIQSALAALARTSYDLEDQYTENGGEVTAETEALEEQKAALAELLNGEGIDSLGRWLKSKEDEKATYKAEKAAADARIKSVDKTIDFIKHEIGRILRETGCEKVKGAFYTFAPYDSVKTSYDAEALDAQYLEKVTEAVRAAGLPSSIDVALKTTSTRLSADESTAHFVQQTTDQTCKFTKPRAKKED